jgi:signal transduction histidine kinase
VQWTGGIAARIDETLTRVRRIATELHPSVLDHLGLVAAVEWQASEFESRTGIPVRLDLPPDLPALDGDRATTVFRILQEALTNVARHSKATEVGVRLRVDGELGLEVRDNGVGLPPTRPPVELSLGLVGMRERAIACGGEVQVRTASGEGTSVVARIPLDVEASGGPEGGEPRAPSRTADPPVEAPSGWTDHRDGIEWPSASGAPARRLPAPTA